VNAVDTVIDAVRRVEFGPLTTFRNLGLLALSTAGEREADYLTLDEALERHSAHIVEINEGGHVPELKIVKEGEVSVLLLDGEELLGAKQNRIINLTILAPPIGLAWSRCRASSRADGMTYHAASQPLRVHSSRRAALRRCGM
jgi:hypothetical protein